MKQERPPFLLGVTGGIGTGKSTVVGWLAMILASIRVNWHRLWESFAFPRTRRELKRCSSFTSKSRMYSAYHGRALFSTDFRIPKSLIRGKCTWRLLNILFSCFS